MNSKPLSQEALKLIACVSMLIDHIGAAFSLGWSFRIIGRMAFPLYCFLIAEGARHTSNPKGYAFRLALAALLSEIPYDLFTCGSLTMQKQSVILTLLLGYLALVCMDHIPFFPLNFLAAVPFAWVAQKIHCDYGGNGVLLIALFGIAKDLPYADLFRAAGLAIMSTRMSPLKIPLLGTRVQIGLFAFAAILPIALYSGEKRTISKGLQSAFYCFYPVHMLLLWIMKTIL